MKRLLTVIVTSVASFLLAASVVLAQSPVVVSGYGGQGGAAAEVESGGALPFTGLDLALLIGGGIVLVAVGVLIRRFSRAA